jgi:hypothetical protein
MAKTYHTRVEMSSYIDYMGKRLAVVNYVGNLYRADTDDKFSQPGVLASQDYAGAEIKFFATNKEETEPYTRYDMPLVKSWALLRPLVLVNMFDRATRDAVRDLFVENTLKYALNTAFPLNQTGRVFRHSDEITKEQDYVFLRTLCASGIPVDGFIVERQEPRPGVGYFHSEVGLCGRALQYLKLATKPERKLAPGKTRSNKPVSRLQAGPNINTNTTNTTTQPGRFGALFGSNTGPNSPPPSRFGALFGSNTGLNSPPSIKRFSALSFDNND